MLLIESLSTNKYIKIVAKAYCKI